jgi:hypothetical protein
MTQNQQRRRIFIDRPVQVALLFRATLYWAVCLIAQLMLVFFFAIVSLSADEFDANGPQLWWHLQLSVLASAVILPVILLDLLKLSHRWVGPIFRLRKCLHALSRREPIPPIRFRDGDFWQGLAHDINAVATELHRQREPSPEDEDSVAVGSPQAKSALEALRGSDSKPASAAAV